MYENKNSKQRYDDINIGDKKIKTLNVDPSKPFIIHKFHES